MILQAPLISGATGVAYRFFSKATLDWVGAAITDATEIATTGIFATPELTKPDDATGVYWYCDTEGVTASDDLSASGALTETQADELSAIAAAVGAGRLTYAGPVSADGTTITLVSGMDYKNTDGRAISFTLANGADLTGASVVLNIGGFLSIAGTVPSATQARFELTKAQSAILSGRDIPFSAIATLTNLDIIEIALGTVNVLIPATGTS